MPYMTRLASDLKAFGLKVEAVPGWETRGSSSFAPACVVGHWTAGPRNSTTRPSLNVVVNGRSDLSGPLCNVYFARDATCVLVAAGRANHAGVGGFRGLVGNSAAYGIEAEAADNSDWTDAQRAGYPRLVAAMLRGLGRDASWFCGHSEWAGPRKTDINGYTPAVMRAQAAAILANPTLPPPEEEDMTPEQAATLTQLAKRAGHIEQMVSDVAARQYAQIAADSDDPAQIAAALAPLLVAQTVALSDVDLSRIATAVADEQARRQAA